MGTDDCQTACVQDLVIRLRAAGCVYAEDEARLLTSAAQGAALEALVARRTAGERLEDVLGWAEFCGLRIAMEPRVFVPRPRTEFLLDLATPLLHPGAVLVDLCCGTGALGAVLLHRVPGTTVHAADLDPAATRCARRNLPAGAVHTGDLFDALPTALRGTVDVVVANVPYVPHDDLRLLPAEARDHEDPLALDGGADGLDVLRRVLTGVGQWWRPGGHLLVEVTPAQVPAATSAAHAAGLRAVARTSEEFETTVLLVTAGTAPA